MCGSFQGTQGSPNNFCYFVSNTSWVSRSNSSERMMSRLLRFRLHFAQALLLALQLRHVLDCLLGPECAPSNSFPMARPLLCCLASNFLRHCFISLCLSTYVSGYTGGFMVSQACRCRLCSHSQDSCPTSLTSVPQSGSSQLALPCSAIYPLTSHPTACLGASGDGESYLCLLESSGLWFFQSPQLLTSGLT